MRYSDHFKNYIISEYDNGQCTIKRLAKQFNISQTTIRRWIKEDSFNKRNDLNKYVIIVNFNNN
ncbi:MAG: transposase [Clostridium sp.]|nr:transposase [Clostridium sp.]